VGADTRMTDIAMTTDKERVDAVAYTPWLSFYRNQDTLCFYTRLLNMMKVVQFSLVSGKFL